MQGRNDRRPWFVAAMWLVCATWLAMPALALAQGEPNDADPPTDTSGKIALSPGALDGAPAPDAGVVIPQIDSGTTAWMLTSTSLVLLMVPGLAMFYGGLVRTKNVLGTMMHCFAAMAIVGVIWAVYGYAVAFGETVCGWWGWSAENVLLRGIDTSDATQAVNPDTGIPHLVFAMFQGKFAIITPALIAGAFAERIKFRGWCVFVLLWTTIVYLPLCHSVWSAGGYLLSKGAIDFAGGTVVHISAGVSGLVGAIYLGARRGYPATAMHPNNLVMTLVGAGLLWVGWFGFNAGSAVSSGIKTAQALTVTQVAAAAGALGWVIVEGLRHGKATSLGMASGVIAGLVVITPAAGAVGVPGAIVLGFAASLTCFIAIALKNRLGYDDTLDVFGIHGVAGIVGALGLTLFIRAEEAPGKLFSEAWFGQLFVQFEGVGITIVGAGVVTLILLFVIDKTVGIAMNDDGEMAGMDHHLHGEHGYGLLNPE